MIRKLSGLLAFVLIFGFATSAFAQQAGGGVRGSVLGADSGTIVEIVDEARGITKSSRTGPNGEFRFDNLEPGAYEVRVLQGGTLVDTEDVRVTLASATVVSMATTAAAIEEIITTGTRMAALDTSIAESGLVISADDLIELPVQRNLTSVAMLAPGVSLGDYRFNGAGGKNDGIVSFAGASIAENTNFINGLNLTNFRTGVGFSQVPFEFYESLQVKTGGYSAKYGRSLGGVLNARTKSGSNDFQVGANIYYVTQLEESPETYLAANRQDAEDETTYDVFVSGPIVKDHLFFYALYSSNTLDKEYAGAQSGRAYDFAVDEGFWGVKLDGYITDDHHIEITAFSDEREGIEDTYAFDYSTGQWGAYQGPTTYNEGGDNWIATYTGDFTDNLSLSLSYGENEANRTTESATAAVPTVYQYIDGGFQALGEWTSFLLDVGEDSREMTRADLAWQVGDHSLNFGIDYENNTATNFTINSGGVYWLLDVQNTYNSCDVATECPQGANARRRTYANGGEFEVNSEAWYIQDVWDINENWTVELGLRNETFENLNGEGNVFVEVDDQWAPRMAVVWDPKGDGSSKVFANYGLYYLPIAANTNIRMAGGETYIHDYYDWDGVSVDAQFVPQGLGAIYDTIVYGNGEVPDTRSVTDENIEPMYQSEIILGYTRTLDSGIEVGIKGIYRNLEKTIEDVAIDAAVIDYYNSTGTWDDTLVGGATVEDVFGGFHQYVLTNPGQNMRVYIPEQNETIDLTAAQLGYPEAERKYGAIELNVSRPFDGVWSLDGSYTWAHSYGNHEGYVQSDIGQDDAGITQNFDQPGMTDFSYGDLPNDRRHTIKAWGTYQFDNGVRLGSSLMWQSGRPQSCFGVHPTDVFAAAYGAFSFYCDGEFQKRGTVGRTPDILNVDMSAQYVWDVGQTDVTLTLDVFNIFNSQNATLINEIGQTFSGAPDPDYGKIQQFQRPRWLRLSARVEFN